MTTLPRIDCSLCKSTGSLAPTRIYRNGVVEIALGIMIAIVARLA